MSKPSWHDAMEPPKKKKAVALKVGKDGIARVVKTAEGAAAEKLIAKAAAAGAEVQQNPEKVEQLLQQKAEQVEQALQKAHPENNGMPPEIYELMVTIMNFAQELNEQWMNPPFEQE